MGLSQMTAIAMDTDWNTIRKCEELLWKLERFAEHRRLDADELAHKAVFERQIRRLHPHPFQRDLSKLPKFSLC